MQFGHSEDHRPDLLQVKIMVSALDPLGMPVATSVATGCWTVGECQMGVLETRACIQAGGDTYLCSLSET